MGELGVVGQPCRRVEALDKVLGSARYGEDLTLPGMLHAKTLRSPFAHAKVLRVDTSKAERTPGVRAVLTAKSVAGTGRYGVLIPDQPVLIGVGGEALMVGDPIALVAADSEKAAKEAVALIEVLYQELDAIADPEEAKRPDAPRLHEGAPGNLCGHFEYSHGDIEAGFARADAIVEGTFVTPRQDHAFLEPEAGVATVDDQGHITVYAGTQDIFYTRLAIAKALGIPEAKLRVVSLPMGGAFGARIEPAIHIHLALLASRTGRPVKMVWTREESMLVHTKRHPMRIRHRIGATADGKITALEVEVLLDGGAYASLSPAVLEVMCGYLPGPYDIPNVKITGDAVYTNNPISGQMRGFGGPQAMVATECQVDALARKLGTDPAEMRLKNAIGKDRPPMLPWLADVLLLKDEVSLSQTLQRALQAAGPPGEPSRPNRRRGRGICWGMPAFDISGAPLVGMKGTGAMVEMCPDGSVVVRSGFSDHGTGIATVLSQIVAEELGIKVENIVVVSGDTASTPKAGPTIASRSTYTSGNAVKLAAQKVKAALLEKAAEKLEANVQMLEMKGGRIRVKEAPERGMTLEEVATACFQEGANLVGEAWFVTEVPGVPALLGHTYMTTIADVEVDVGTGEVRVLKVVTAHDSGRALNPQSVRGQLLGGALQGMGYALMETMPSEKGVLMARSLREYLVSTSLDMPEEMVVDIVEEPSSTGPYGAKGVAEHAMDTVPGAILNAIYDAVGVRVLEFPATPERIMKGLQAKDDL